jgi:hypothetical protein
MWNRLSPHMRAFLLPLICIAILCAVMWTPADAVEPKIVREIAIIPCVGPPLYFFVFDSGSVAVFDLQRATEDPQTRDVLMSLIAKAKTEVTLKELVLRQHCPKEGAST